MKKGTVVSQKKRAEKAVNVNRFPEPDFNKFVFSQTIQTV